MPSSRRLPIYILVDVSESTAGEVADSIDAGLNHLITSLRRNPQALETAAVSIITFCGIAKQVVPLTDLISFKRPRLILGSGTSLGAAIVLWQDAMRREVVMAKPGSGQKSDYRPLAFILTDGVPTDDMSSAISSLRSEAGVKSHLVCLACGDNVDLDVLFSLSSNVVHMKEANASAFASFFKWVTQSVDMTSKSIQSTGSSSFEMPTLDPAYLRLADKSLAVKVDKDHQKFMLVKCQTQGLPYLIRFEKRVVNQGSGTFVGYEAIAAHRLEAFDEGSTGNASIENPLGRPIPCPYCENSSIGICECGKPHCLSPDPAKQKFSKCPHCGNVGEYGDGGPVTSLRGGNG